MTYLDLVDVFAARARIPHEEARESLGLVWILIAAEVRSGKRFSVPKFGVFYRATRKQRLIENPVTRQPMRIPAEARLGLRASRHQKWKRP